MRWTFIKTKKLPQNRLMQLLDSHKIDLVLDVGANIGQYSKSLRKGGYKGRIVSFEPTSAAHASITNTSIQDPKWQVAPQQAIGDMDGHVDINVSSDSDMSSILDLEESTVDTLPGSLVSEVENVPIFKLSSIFETYKNAANKTFLKVDTQGFEWQVLQGAEDILPQISGIQLELSLLPMYKGEQTFEKITGWLNERNFEPHLIIPGYFSRKLNRQMQVDIIFFRKP